MTRRFFLAVCVAVSVVAGAAQPSWADGDDQDFLGAHGFPAGQFTLIWQWDEASPAAAGRLITGYSLQATGSDARIDVYRDGDKILSDAERQALGIRPKRWTPSAASAPSEPGSAVAKAAEPVVRPKGAGRKLPLEVLSLGPYSPVAAIQVVGAETQEKPMNQIGDFRDLTAPVSLAGETASLGAWQALADGGFLWQMGVESPGATGQRLHLAHYVLPEGARLVVYNPAKPEEAFAETGSGENHWLPTIFNSEVAVEVFAPTAATRDGVALTLDRTIHMNDKALQAKALAGACNLDVTCYPDWAETALGICGIGVVGSSGALFCTATLLSSVDPCAAALPPYVLTAHHCVGGQSGTRGASDLEFYWFYQTATCNDGSPPNLASVPRTTGGADYLAGAGGTGFTGGGNDFTLLRMRNAPPVTATHVGWTAAVPAVATEVTDVHHPWGEYKRISFGTLTGAANTHAEDYLEVLWHNGTTEPGSSGSPLMLTDTHQILGQLWGGGASCTASTEHDYFGRFSNTYPVVQAYLDPGPALCAFSSAQFSANEADATAQVSIILTRLASSGGVDVDYAATPGTARAGEDFTPVSGTLHFTNAQLSQGFSVPLLDDFHADDGKTILLSLSVVAPGCVAADPLLNASRIVITDNDADSDGDGISDYDEINGTYGPPTNPNAADSDRDGLSDHEELFGTFGYITNPNDPDTDDDTVDDFLEILSGTDPTVADAHLGSLSLPWFEDVK